MRGKSGGPTMHDVAAVAGVSQATVSLVLNEVPGSRVSAATRNRVHDAVRSLGYRTNANAKALRAGASGLIGFVGDVVASSPFAGRIVEGAQERAWEDGLLTLVVNTGGDPDIEEASIEALLSHRVVGIVYASMYHRRVSVPELAREVPCVVLNSVDAAGELPGVVPDERLGGLEATGHLIDAGHRRIGMINIETLASGLPAALGRHEGYVAAHEHSELPLDEGLVRFGDGNPDSGYAYARELLTLAEPPTAIFCANDRTAWGAYQAVADLGLRVPDDVSIVGFDDQETLAPFLRPGLTTMKLPFVEMGRRAVEALRGGPGAATGNELLRCPLVERGSVAERPR